MTQKKSTPATKKPNTTKKTTSRKKTSTVRTNADKIKISKKVFEDYSTGEFTLESCCGKQGITARTLNNWAASISEVSDLFKKAKDEAAKATKEGLKAKAVSSLEKLITGFSVEEEETKEVRNIAGRVIQKTTIKKTRHFAPNVTAVIFALKALDPVTWNENHFAGDDQGEQVFEVEGQIIKF